MTARAHWLLPNSLCVRPPTSPSLRLPRRVGAVNDPLRTQNQRLGD
jgi:hypothetical protein